MNLQELNVDTLMTLKNAAQGNFSEMLVYSEELFRRHPDNSSYLDNCIYASVMAENWEKAIYYAEQGIERDDNRLNSLNALSHAYYGMRNAEKCRLYGNQALQYYHHDTLKNEEITSLPQPEFREGKKIISFSLFGSGAKYLETAVLNAELAARIYPGWICRFYIDDEIPYSVIERLIKYKAEIFKCDLELQKMPKTMWRFLPLDDSSVSCVIFRDADSIISPREAQAVNEWLKSDKSFHTLRDNGSHTALILAGLWGAKCGTLPKILPLMWDFVRKGNLDGRFADQDFLRIYLWKYIFQSLYATDSIFTFRDYHPFPDGKQFIENFLGRTEVCTVEVMNNWEDGAIIKWKLFSQIDPLIDEKDEEYNLQPERFICEYESVVKDGKLKIYLPRRYAQGFAKKHSRLEYS